MDQRTRGYRYRRWGFGVLMVALSNSMIARSEIVGVFFDDTLPQSSFAASEIQKALANKKHTVELRALSSLSEEYTHRKIVLSLAADREAGQVLSIQGGATLSGLGEQAYALRTTNKGGRSYWVLGGDVNGLMYGGLQLAENLRFDGLSETYNAQEAPYIKNRGVKYNLALDARSPTFFGSKYKAFPRTFGGDAAREAVAHVWDMTYWEDWFDEMARARFNVISIWNTHPFPALLELEESIQDVEGFDGYSKKMTSAEKVAFWQKVMAYGKGRGFSFYFVTWNIYTYGAEGKNGIDNDPKNEATKNYFRKAVRQLFETYPDLAGLGVTAGENMPKLSAEEEGRWMWDSYGRGIMDYAKEHPERELTFIHRWHYAEISQIMDNFEPLLALPNVRLDLSYKYSAAHMYSAPAPRLIYTKDGDVPADLARTHKKTWLEVRQDDFYFLHLGHPQFARDYLYAFPDKDKYIQGFFYGSDGWTAARDFYSKTDVHKNMLDIKRLWYTQMIWGRLSYNPETPDQVFIDEMAYRYPNVSAPTLFSAWSDASRGLPLASEVVQGSLCYDFHWWPELCQSAKSFRKIADFIEAKPSVGSDICSIADSAAGNCSKGRTSDEIADEIQAAGEAALKKLESISATGNPDLEVNIKSIYAQAYLSLYYAEKIRGATALAAHRNEDAKIALGKAVSYWENYTSIMDDMFIGVHMLRSKNFKNWHVHDAAVTKEYTDLGGDAKDAQE